MKLHLGEVVLIRMEFHRTAGGKVRPAVVLLDAGDDDFVATPITSQPRHSEFDLEIHQWRAAGLNVASSSQSAHKLSVLSKGEIVRHLGTLSAPDREALIQLLSRAFRA
jgi:mRNA-degrading endonuclease toxin of MazEF toxin-antitoxin module